jgi:hypothetical protein
MCPEEIFRQVLDDRRADVKTRILVVKDNTEFVHESLERRFKVPADFVACHDWEWQRDYVPLSGDGEMRRQTLFRRSFVQQFRFPTRECQFISVDVRGSLKFSAFLVEGAGNEGTGTIYNYGMDETVVPEGKLRLTGAGHQL